MVGILVSFWDGIFSGAILRRKSWFVLAIFENRLPWNTYQTCQVLWGEKIRGKKPGSSSRTVKKKPCNTLPETNELPLKMLVSNRNLLFQRSIFRGYVSFRECNVAGHFTYLKFKLILCVCHTPRYPNISSGLVFQVCFWGPTAFPGGLGSRVHEAIDVGSHKGFLSLTGPFVPPFPLAAFPVLPRRPYWDVLRWYLGSMDYFTPI